MGDEIKNMVRECTNKINNKGEELKKTQGPSSSIDLVDLNIDMNIKANGNFNSLGLIGRKLETGEKRLSYMESLQYIDQLKENQAITSLICTQEVYDQLEGEFAGGIVVEQKPRSLFFRIQNQLATDKEIGFYGEDFDTIISEKAIIAESAIVESKNVIIGENCVIGERAIIKAGTYMKSNVMVGEGSVIGAEGFYYYDTEKGKKRVLAAGGVSLGDNVEILCNTVICKGMFGGDTSIGDGSKIDSLVFLAHDVNIGTNTLIPAGTTLAGYTNIGSDVFVGVSSCTSPLVNIGNGAMVSMGSAVNKDVPAKGHVTGNLAIEHKKYVEAIKKMIK